jgi:hypothetical protein
MKLPQGFQVEIFRGEIDVFGYNLPLPIRGKGTFTVVYVDDVMRIFQSPSGTLSVQIRDDKLQQML